MSHFIDPDTEQEHGFREEYGTITGTSLADKMVADARAWLAEHPKSWTAYVIDTRGTAPGYRICGEFANFNEADIIADVTRGRVRKW